MDDVEKALEVKERHLQSLMDIEGVIGVGIGLEDETVVIVVNVEKITDEILEQIPEVLDGFRVKVEEVGTIEAVNDDES